MPFFDIKYRKEWAVLLTRRAVKQAFKLDDKVIRALRLLSQDLAREGPAPGAAWANYSKLKGRRSQDRRHCHLIKGKPTYVCCWEVLDKKEKKIEVYYVGTHEKAPY